MVCGAQVQHTRELFRPDFYQEFLNLVKYYGLDTEKFSSLEQRRSNLKSQNTKKWLKRRWSSYYFPMYNWDSKKALIHPRETLHWSQFKAICSLYLDMDIRFNLNRQIAKSKKDSVGRKRAREFQFILRKFAEKLLKQQLQNKLTSGGQDYNISNENINRFILMYARDYMINLASLTISHSMRLAAQAYRQNFALRVPTFKQYRKAYNREVFTRLRPFDLSGQLERWLSPTALTETTFVFIEGKRISSRETIFVGSELRSQVLDILLPKGAARTSVELISKLEKMSIPYQALIEHRRKLSNYWSKNYDLVESKRIEERLIKLLTKPDQEE